MVQVSRADYYALVGPPRLALAQHSRFPRESLRPLLRVRRWSARAKPEQLGCFAKGDFVGGVDPAVPIHK
jgi:hypothetical protein